MAIHYFCLHFTQAYTSVRELAAWCVHSKSYFTSLNFRKRCYVNRKTVTMGGAGRRVLNWTA